MAKRSVADIVRCGMPGATDDDVEHVIWERTPFPCAPVSARSTYVAARRLYRPNCNGVVLCDHCDNKTERGELVCGKCAAALGRECAPDKIV